MAIDISAWKVFEIFATVIVLGLLFGSTIIGIISGIKDGDWGGVLKNTGGKIFGIDKNLIDTSERLETAIAQPTDQVNYDISYNLVFGFTMLFVLFFILTLLFKFGNWAFGEAAFNPLVDIFLIVGIIGIFFTLEYLYTLIVLKESIIPLQGVVKFGFTMPKVLEYLLY